MRTCLHLPLFHGWLWEATRGRSSSLVWSINRPRRRQAYTYGITTQLNLIRWWDIPNRAWNDTYQIRFEFNHDIEESLLGTPLWRIHLSSNPYQPFHWERLVQPNQMCTYNSTFLRYISSTSSLRTAKSVMACAVESTTWEAAYWVSLRRIRVI